jgi:hypothetical protein
MRMASIATGVPLSHVSDGGFRVCAFDLERGDESVFGFDRHLIRLAPDLHPDGIPYAHAHSLRDPTKSWLPHPGTPTRLARIWPTLATLQMRLPARFSKG